MPDVRFPVEIISGVSVVTAPEEIDITNAGELRAALLESAARWRVIATTLQGMSHDATETGTMR